MNEYPNSVALMLPATLETEIEMNVEPHVTMIYLGEMEDITYKPFDLINALTGLYGFTLVRTTPKEFELFGENKDVLVVTLDEPVLHILHSMVEKRIASIGAKSASSFSEFKPHITIQEGYTGGLDGLELPANIVLEPLEIWWGTNKITLDKDE